MLSDTLQKLTKETLFSPYFTDDENEAISSVIYRLDLNPGSPAPKHRRLKVLCFFQIFVFKDVKLPRMGYIQESQSPPREPQIPNGTGGSITLPIPIHISPASYLAHWLYNHKNQ